MQCGRVRNFTTRRSRSVRSRSRNRAASASTIIRCISTPIARRRTAPIEDSERSGDPHTSLHAPHRAAAPTASLTERNPSARRHCAAPRLMRATSPGPWLATGTRNPLHQRSARAGFFRRHRVRSRRRRNRREGCVRLSARDHLREACRCMRHQGPSRQAARFRCVAAAQSSRPLHRRIADDEAIKLRGKRDFRDVAQFRLIEIRPDLCEQRRHAHRRGAAERFLRAAYQGLDVLPSSRRAAPACWATTR